MSLEIKDKGFASLIIIGATIGSLIIVVTFFLLKNLSVQLTTFFYLFASFIAIFPPAIYKYIQFKKMKEIDDMFPVFLRDLVQTIRGGMTIPLAFKRIAANDYKNLTPLIKKMSAQMAWGIPIEKILMNFSKQSKSKLISRVISSVIESHRFGGNLADTFEALSNTSLEVDRLRAERRLYMNSQLMTGYIIFFVFLAVIIGLEKFLTPSLASIKGESLGLSSTSGAQLPPEVLVAEYKNIYRNLIIIQGLFAGLSVGKMAEGSLMNGIKHSLFMVFAGSIIFTLASG